MMASAAASLEPRVGGKAFITVAELVQLGYGSKATIWREVNDGEIPAMRTKTGRILVPCDEFANYLDSIRVTAKPAN